MLDDLAPELVQHVASFLDKRDLSSLRLVCRRLAATTSRHFADIEFGTLSISFSRASLNRLESIANHEAFQRSVRKLLVRPSADDLDDPGPHKIEIIELDDIDSKLKISLRRNVETLHCLLTNMMTRCKSFEITGEGPRSIRSVCLITLSLRDLIPHVLGLPTIESFRICLNGDEPFHNMHLMTVLDILIFLMPQTLSLSWTETQMDSYWLETNMVTSAGNIQEVTLDSNSLFTIEAFIDVISSEISKYDIKRLTLRNVLPFLRDVLSKLLYRFGESLESVTFISMTLEPEHWGDLIANLRADFPLLTEITRQDCLELYE
jgi:hypothetical protein